MKQNLEIVRGTSNVFGINVTNDDGSPYVLSDGEEIIFGLKRCRLDEDRVLIKEITSKTNDVYLLELTPEDTCELECGKYFYDVGLQSGENVFYNIIELSEFLIKPNATKCGDCM